MSQRESFWTGIEYPAAKWVIKSSEGDIFKRKRRKKSAERKRRKNKEKRSEVLQISISVITLFMKNMESVFTAESKRSQQMGLKRTTSVLNIRAVIIYLF